MEKMTEQYLLKMSIELSEMIDQAHSKHLKETGEYVSKAEYMRRALLKHCLEALNV
jgi:Arc/MetJ-type ribon-helix-helix transcriptional regulator